MLLLPLLLLLLLLLLPLATAAAATAAAAAIATTATAATMTAQSSESHLKILCASALPKNSVVGPTILVRFRSAQKFCCRPENSCALPIQQACLLSQASR